MAYSASMSECVQNTSAVPQWYIVMNGPIVCDEFNAKGIDTLYLLTDHISFYERYGWEFLCMVQGDGEPVMSRMYVHKNTL